MKHVIFFFLSLLLLSLSFTPLLLADSQFEGFDAEEDVVEDEDETLHLHKLTDLPLTQSDSSPPIANTRHHSPDPKSDPDLNPNPTPSHSDSQSKPASSQTMSFDYWDEDEFEGVPIQHPPSETPTSIPENATADQTTAESKTTEDSKNVPVSKKSSSYIMEIVCATFRIMFIINYFTGKRENENLAVSWAAKFATKDSIFEKNFSLLGVEGGEDSPFLLKEGQNVFKFYGSGRRYCSGLLATMELKSRHDLIARLYNMIVPCKDEISLRFI